LGSRTQQARLMNPPRGHAPGHRCRFPLHTARCRHRLPIGGVRNDAPPRSDPSTRDCSMSPALSMGTALGSGAEPHCGPWRPLLYGLYGGTDSSDPFPSSGESANSRSRISAVPKLLFKSRLRCCFPSMGFLLLPDKIALEILCGQHLLFGTVKQTPLAQCCLRHSPRLHALTR
jgi:hypothetical protein